MMKKFYTFLIALLLSGIVFAQWQELPSFTNATLTQIQFVDENTGWITGYYSATNSGILFRTTDGGQSWDSTTFNHHIAGLCFIDQNMGFATRNYSLMKTIDGGKTWTYHSIPNNPPQVLFLDQDTGWIGGYAEGLYRTTDGGDNWEDLSGGLPVLLSRMEFQNTNNGYYSGFNEGEDYSFYSTTDGGESWNLIFDKFFNDFKMFENQYGYGIECYGSINGGSISGFYKTNDNGVNWNEILTPNPQLEYFQSLGFIDENVGWISVWNSPIGFTGQGEIYFTSDGGESWTKQFDQGVTDFEIINESNIWALATNYWSNESTIYYTTDVGVDENSTLNQKYHQLLVFPNPSSSSITLELPTQPSKYTTLTISNTNGQQLITQPITKPQTEIDISHLPVGIYIVKVWNDEDVMVRKIIKQ